LAVASAQIPLGYPAGVYAAGIPIAGAYNAAPIVAAAPAPVIPAPLAAPSSQFHAQDELENFNYGYANINSVKQEVGNANTGVQGSYSYVDANGIVQRVDYVADALGFRVAGTNLPVAPAPIDAVLPLAPLHTRVAPEPVMDTPEVAAAKAAHLELLAAAESSRKKRSAQLIAPLPYAFAGKINGVAAPLATATALTATATAPLAYGYAGVPAIAAPGLTYAAAPAIAAPAVVANAAPAIPSTLTTIQLNPGHAVAYNVLPDVA